MRTYTYIIASSAPISPSTTLFFASTAAQNIDYTNFYALQSNFGGPTPTGTLTLLTSNVNELAMGCPAASAFVNSSGSVMFNNLSAGYEWIWVKFATSGTSSTGIMSVVLQSKGF